MRLRTVSFPFVIILFLDSLIVGLRISVVNAWTGTVYIRADGSVDPPTASIQRDGDVYTLTDDITRGGGSLIGGFEIVIERNNMILDGAGHVLRSDRYDDKGIYISGRSNVTVKNLQFSIVTGIYLLFSSNNAILGNDISSSENGIFLQDSSYNLISGNSIEQCFEPGGIQLLRSDNNIICDNKVVNNVVSILFDHSSKNIIYHNNFIDSPFPLEDPSYTNFYDNGYPTGGNYWSDYKGIDLFKGPYQNVTGSDGIIDIPCDADRYPLIFPWGEPHLPVAEFLIRSASTQMLAAESVVFNASQSLGGWNGTYAFPITEYRWDFGDGSQTTTANPIIIHVFTEGRTYNTKLTVLDSEGLNSSYSRLIKIWMPSIITISTSSSTTVVGFAVDINGTLVDTYGRGLEYHTVVLYYTFSGTDNWIPITSDQTDNLGRYSVKWIPAATGDFTLKAEWTGNMTHVASSNTVSLSSVAYQGEYIFSAESNSTITSMSFETSERELTFTVSGPSGTTGYANVYVSRSLIGNIEEVEVKLNGTEIKYTATSLDDSWLIHFTYQHSLYTVAVNLGALDSSQGETTGIDALTAALLIAVLAVGITTVGILTRRRRIRKKL